MWLSIKRYSPAHSAPPKALSKTQNPQKTPYSRRRICRNNSELKLQWRPITNKRKNLKRESKFQVPKSSWIARNRRSRSSLPPTHQKILLTSRWTNRSNHQNRNKNTHIIQSSRNQNMGMKIKSSQSESVASKPRLIHLFLIEIEGGTFYFYFLRLSFYWFWQELAEARKKKRKPHYNLEQVSPFYVFITLKRMVYSGINN